MDSDGRSRSDAFYAVLGHEVCHYTGTPTRLARNFGKRFGDDAYCFEEACALSGQFGCGLSRQSGATLCEL